MEFSLIDRIAARVTARADVLLGIGDDAALLQPRAGMQLAASCDVLNVGVHFAADDPPSAIGHKAAAVNLSDLAAMGAEPAWCLLGLSLPEADIDWLDGFLEGFLGLAAQHGMALVGGDTTCGPCSIAVTVQGWVPAGRALRRDGARVGDELWVSGTLGDAAAGLARAGAGGAAAFLRARLQRPTPRIALGQRLHGLAHAAIDVSDGLLADLGHVLARSGVGATIELDVLPASEALRESVRDPAQRRIFQCSGGDDYELLFSASPERSPALNALADELGLPLTRIGRIESVPGCRIVDAAGQPVQMLQRGWQHFAGAV